MRKSAAIFLTLCLTPSLSRGGPVDDESHRAAVAVMAAYSANLESFTRVTCRFTVAANRAYTIADALAGRYLDAPRVAKGMWSRDGDDQSYDFVEDEESTKSMDNPKKKLTPVKGLPGLLMGEPVPFTSSRAIRSSSHSMVFKARGAYINVRDEPKDVFVESPVGVVGNAHSTTPVYIFMERLKSGDYRRLSVTSGSDGGEPTVTISMRWTNSGNVVEDEHVFAPANGYSLVRSRSQSHDRVMNLQIDEYPDTRDAGGGRWYPARKVSLHNQKQNTWFGVRETRIQSFEVDKAPAPELMRIVLPSGTQVVYQPLIKSSFLLRRPETITTDRLPVLVSMVKKQAEIDARAETDPTVMPMDTALPPPPSRRRWLYAGLGAGGLIAAAFAVRFLRRRSAT